MKEFFMSSISLFRPFKGIRPTVGFAQEVVAPPYDVLSSQEAREKANDKPYSFLHISKAEIDLPQGTNPYAPEVYAKSAENYHKLIQEGILKQDEKACYYVYRAVMGEHIQTGLAVSASVKAYDDNRIRRHEFTRPDKEDDRVRQIDALDAQTGPVLIAYHQIQSIKEIIENTMKQTPCYEVVGDYDVKHSLWIIDKDEDIETITKAFDEVPAVYIADGHHRSAAASRVAKQRQENNPSHTGNEAYNSFLAVAFPIEEMKILDYNRLVKDLNGLNKESFLLKLEEKFSVTLSSTKAPETNRTFGMYLDGQWYTLVLKEVDSSLDAVERLDVSLLSNLILDPILGIKDLRTDKRIDFVGGMRGAESLEEAVNSKAFSVAFMVYPTQMQELIDVADSEQVMPPKSTWFEPKLADGMVSNPI